MKPRAYIANLWLFLRSGAPLPVFGIYHKRLLLELLTAASRKRFLATAELMAPIDSGRTFTTRWFDVHARVWTNIVKAERLFDKPITILEIGSWEGRSTCFFLHYLKSAHITAVDTWQGGDEHLSYMQLTEIEKLFESNVALFADRVTKARSTSLEYFCKRDSSVLFDVIYVDGSHHADDVMNDALLSFAVLKPGGIMIFDDYRWRFYKNIRHNPAFAINLFSKDETGRIHDLKCDIPALHQEALASPAICIRPERSENSLTPIIGGFHGRV